MLKGFIPSTFIKCIKSFYGINNSCLCISEQWPPGKDSIHLGSVVKCTICIWKPKLDGKWLVSFFFNQTIPREKKAFFIFIARNRVSHNEDTAFQLWKMMPGMTGSDKFPPHTHSQNVTAFMSRISILKQPQALDGNKCLPEEERVQTAWVKCQVFLSARPHRWTLSR